MVFRIEHELVNRDLDIERVENGALVHYTAVAQGEFRVMRPGKVLAQAGATLWHRLNHPGGTVISGTHGTVGGIGNPVGSRWTEEFPDPLIKPDAGPVPFDLEIRILDPDGKHFTAAEVTVSDLERFKDLRGIARPWFFTVAGTSQTFRAEEVIGEPAGKVFMQITETVLSASAAPLVDSTELGADVQRFEFDLYRIGDLVAEVTPLTDTAAPWQGTLRLVDPDGSEIARDDDGSLRCPIGFSHLARSRDAATWAPRPWTLEVLPQAGSAAGTHTVGATVLGQVRLNPDAVKARAEKLFGADGHAIEIVGKDRPRDESVGPDLIEAVLTIHDPVAAETIDMHGLLDDRLPKKSPDGTRFHLRAEEPVSLGLTEANIGTAAEIYLKVGSLRVASISAELTRTLSRPGGLVNDGPFPEGTPVLRLDVGVEGRLELHTLAGPLSDPVHLADVSAKGGHVAVELGITFGPDTEDVDGDGDLGPRPTIRAWMVGEPFDFDFEAAGLAIAVVALNLVAATAEDFISKLVNDGVQEKLDDLFGDPDTVNEVLMLVLGTHLDWKAPRYDAEQSVEVVFEYVAPVEPEPKPKSNYAAVIGRDFEILPTGDVRVTGALGDLEATWVADNLTAKIDHIVVVMMENRSYDHVLGYRAMASRDGSRPADGADGWTQELIDAVNKRFPAPGPDEEVPIRPMRQSAFAKNLAGRHTCLPSGVGHSVASVAQQLAGRFEGPGGRKINDPAGFVENFLHKYLHDHYRDPETGVVQWDVLRYYETDHSVTYDGTSPPAPVDDLPVYDFLANNFAYSDTFFCSHPGPTLPNRMFLLTGDFQHDRFGYSIPDNNSGDNFLLSRAPTIFDILEREGVSWRVYESGPSVAMLRFFARYAGETTRILKYEQFATDVADGVLPQFVMIEPQMHAHPEDDDHPPADMWRGQKLIGDIYATLTSEPELFERTMLIVTYDEHGGLYDHVIPPVAEVLKGTDLPGGGQNTGPVSDDRDDGWTSEGDAGDGGSSGGGSGAPGTRYVGLGRSREVLRDVAMGERPSATSGENTRPVEPKVPAVPVPYGVRVPTFVVSPWVPAGKGPSVTLDFCSILKTVLARFCGDTRPFLSDRVEASYTLEAFLTEPAPRPIPAGLPTIDELPLTVRSGGISPATAIGTAPLFRSQMIEGEVDSHELMGRLARMLGR